MKNINQKDLLIACCHGILENADAITADWNHTQRYSIHITFEPDSIPAVTVEKEFIPNMVIDVLQNKN